MIPAAILNKKSGRIALRPLNAHRPRHDFSGLEAHRETEFLVQENRLRHEEMQRQVERNRAAEAAWQAREEHRQRIRVKVARWVTAIGALIGAAYGIFGA